jgi:hypothetical protein
MFTLWNAVPVACSTGLVAGDTYYVNGTVNIATVTSFLAPASTITVTASPCCQWHIIASGDTCSLIADEHRITLATIEERNPSLGVICTIHFQLLEMRFVLMSWTIKQFQLRRCSRPYFTRHCSELLCLVRCGF